MIDEKENKNEELEVNLEEVETEKEVNVPLVFSTTPLGLSNIL